MENKKKTPWQEIIEISETMKEVKRYIQKKIDETKEIKKDFEQIKRDFIISKKCYKAGIYGDSKYLIQFLLQGDTEEKISIKFPPLLELVGVYTKILNLVNEVKKEAKEHKGEN